MHSISARVLKNAVSKRSISSEAMKRQNLDGRVAIAIGCTEGIGFAMAQRLAQHGAHVVLSSRQKKNVDKAVDDLQEKGLKASGFLCHTGNPQERRNLIENTVETQGGIDILINNAGVNSHVGRFLDTPESAFDKAMDVNVKANFCLVRDVYPHMAKRKTQGSILMTSSMSGFQAHCLPGAYAVSKSAIFSLTKAFMPELMEHNIRVNCLTLGCIHTPFSAVLRQSEEIHKRFLRHIPMGRFGEPEECAGLATFLCSDDASYITGENFCVAGGGFSRL